MEQEQPRANITIFSYVINIVEICLLPLSNFSGSEIYNINISFPVELKIIFEIIVKIYILERRLNGSKDNNVTLNHISGLLNK